MCNAAGVFGNGMSSVTILARESTSPAEMTQTGMIEALRRGDEAVFRHLVEVHHTAMRRVAALYVPTGVVEDVVQETWIAVVRGIDRFEGRSSIKTWIYRILINQARKRGPKERRTIPFSALGPSEAHDPAVDLERLYHPELGSGYWPEAPPHWNADPGDRAVASEIRTVIGRAIEALSDAQREVITLRDVEGWDSEEVCDTLGVSAVNQRVLLHRARTSVRAALEVYFHGN